MNDVKTFVLKVYKRKRNLWLLKRSLISLSLFLTSYLFWLWFSHLFYITIIEWWIMPFSFLLTLIPILSGRPTLSSAIDYLEDRIVELKGRLYLIMEPFPSPLDSKKFRKQAIKECSQLLKERDLSEFVNFRIGFNYISPLLILLVLLFTFGFSINTVEPKPVLSYVEEPTLESSPTLILAECPTLRKLYLFYDNKEEKMICLGSGKFALVIKPDNSMDVSAGYRIWRSESRKLKVVPILLIEKLALEYQFPSYLGVLPLNDTIPKPVNNILIRVLSGTIVSFHGRTNEVLGGIHGNLINCKVAGHSFSGNFKVEGDNDIEVELTDTFSFGRSYLHFTIRPIRDEPPSIEFITPGRYFKLDKRMEVPVRLRARDDYGLSSLKLFYGDAEKDLGDAMGVRFIEDSLNLEVTNLMPGETLMVRAAAYDLAGNKTLTPPINIFMPSLEEMFSNYREFSDTLSTKAYELQKKEEELIEKIEEYLFKSKLNPESIYGLKETLKEQKDLLSEIEKMVELAKKMQNPLIMEELSRINELLDELGMKELYKKLENIEINQDFTDRKLRELNLTQEKLLEALKLGRKSLESLKELMELNEFLSRAREIYKEQNIIAEGTPNDSLAFIEEELREKLSELLEEMKNSLNKEINELAYDFGKTGTEQKMVNLAGEMRKGKMDEIKMEEINKALESLYQNLKNMCECRTGEKVKKAIQQKAWELGFVLRKHNELIDKEPGILKGLIEQSLSESVMKVKRELEPLFLMSFAFSPRVFNNLSEASSKMEELGEEIINKKPLRSSMEKVRDLLIESIIGLFSSPPRSSQAMMSAMNAIMNEQKSISNELQQIIPIPGSKQIDILRELSQKQRRLARKLRELGEALNPIARDMEEVASKMEIGELDEKVLERQIKLLDRLLEASESIRRKDISKKRRSRPGIFVSPPKITLPKDLGEEKKALRILLEKRMKEPYPKAYEKEIERYIRKLLE